MSTRTRRFHALLYEQSAVGAGVTFSATGSTASSATADATVLRPLNGFSDTAGGATGSLGVTLGLGGPAPTSADCSGTLTVTSAGLFIRSIPRRYPTFFYSATPAGVVVLDGTAPASNGATAAVTVSRPLTGTAPAADEGSSALTVTPAGTTVLPPSIISDLYHLAFYIPEVGAPVVLDAAAPAAAGASGVLSLGRGINAIGPVSSDAVGAFRTIRSLDAFAASANDSPGSLFTTRPMAGTAASATDARGALSFVPAFSRGSMTFLDRSSLIGV